MVTLGLAQLGPVRPGVDFEEHVVLLDQRPFLEVDLVEVTPDAGPDLDGVDRGRPAGEVRVVGDVPLDGMADRDLRSVPTGASEGGREQPVRAEADPDDNGSATAECYLNETFIMGLASKAVSK